MSTDAQVKVHRQDEATSTGPKTPDVRARVGTCLGGLLYVPCAAREFSELTEDRHDN